MLNNHVLRPEWNTMTTPAAVMGDTCHKNNLDMPRYDHSRLFDPSVTSNSQMAHSTSDYFLSLQQSMQEVLRAKSFTSYVNKNENISVPVPQISNKIYHNEANFNFRLSPFLFHLPPGVPAYHSSPHDHQPPSVRTACHNTPQDQHRPSVRTAFHSTPHDQHSPFESTSYNSDLHNHQPSEKGSSSSTTIWRTIRDPDDSQCNNDNLKMNLSNTTTADTSHEQGSTSCYYSKIVRLYNTFGAAFVLYNICSVSHSVGFWLCDIVFNVNRYKILSFIRVLNKNSVVMKSCNGNI